VDDHGRPVVQPLQALRDLDAPLDALLVGVHHLCSGVGAVNVAMSDAASVMFCGQLVTGIQRCYVPSSTSRLWQSHAALLGTSEATQ
jgi:hypothetical protein